MFCSYPVTLAHLLAGNVRGRGLRYANVDLVRMRILTPIFGWLELPIAVLVNLN